MKQVRICWLPAAVCSAIDIENASTCTSYSGWQEETRESSLEVRSLCDAANKLYGPGSHWIERRDIPVVRDFLSDILPTDSRPAANTVRAMRGNVSVQERLNSSEHWRLMFR